MRNILLTIAKNRRTFCRKTTEKKKYFLIICIVPDVDVWAVFWTHYLIDFGKFNKTSRLLSWKIWSFVTQQRYINKIVVKLSLKKQQRKKCCFSILNFMTSTQIICVKPKSIVYYRLNLLQKLQFKFLDSEHVYSVPNSICNSSTEIFSKSFVN